MSKEITREKLIDLYKNHDTVEIAEMLGVSRATLYKIMDKAGVKRDGRHRRKLTLTLN